MFDAQILSWIVTAIGISGFFLAGRKLWWCWYINIGCQVFWALYAWVSETPAFYFASAFYFIVFSINAFKWSKEHFASQAKTGQYQTKRSPVDALYFEGGINSANDVIDWCASYDLTAWWKEPAASFVNTEGRYIKEMPETIRILDREGTVDLCPGEYVVLGSNQHVYVFESEAFETAYERVT